MFLNGAPDADYEADPARFFALFMAFATELDAAHAHVVAADAKVRPQTSPYAVRAAQPLCSEATATPSLRRNPFNVLGGTQQRHPCNMTCAHTVLLCTCCASSTPSCRCCALVVDVSSEA